MGKFLPLSAFLFFSQAVLGQDQDSSQAQWSYNISAYYFWFSGGNNFLQLSGTADRNRLHLEPRYNYEALNTGSVFAGWKFETGTKVQIEATPMIGLVFGKINGFAPGLVLAISFKILDFYSESEYYIDYSQNSNNFIYTWDELGVTPINHLRFGISAQRTRVYETGLDIQRGVFAEYTFWKLTAGGYYFNPFSNSQFGVISLKFDF
jgi:hypothetical protein